MNWIDRMATSSISSDQKTWIGWGSSACVYWSLRIESRSQKVLVCVHANFSESGEKGSVPMDIWCQFHFGVSKGKVPNSQSIPVGPAGWFIMSSVFSPPRRNTLKSLSLVEAAVDAVVATLLEEFMWGRLCTVTLQNWILFIFYCSKQCCDFGILLDSCCSCTAILFRIYGCVKTSKPHRK